MKFFTREWMNGDMRDQAADAVVLAYQRHLEALGLPQSVQDLAELNPHDGYVLDVEHEAAANALRIRLRCGDLRAGYLDVALTFEAATISLVDEATLSQAEAAAPSEILCAEVDREAGAFTYRLVFHPAGEALIRFSDVTVVRVSVSDRRAV